MYLDFRESLPSIPRFLIITRTLSIHCQRAKNYNYDLEMLLEIEQLLYILITIYIQYISSVTPTQNDIIYQ